MKLSCCQELERSVQPDRLELANRCRQIKTVTQSLSLASVSLLSAGGTGSHPVEALHSGPTSLRCHWHERTIGHRGNKKRSSLSNMVNKTIATQAVRLGRTTDQSPAAPQWRNGNLPDCHRAQPVARSAGVTAGFECCSKGPMMSTRSQWITNCSN